MKTVIYLCIEKFSQEKFLRANSLPCKRMLILYRFWTFSKEIPFFDNFLRKIVLLLFNDLLLLFRVKVNRRTVNWQIFSRSTDLQNPLLTTSEKNSESFSDSIERKMFSSFGTSSYLGVRPLEKPRNIQHMRPFFYKFFVIKWENIFNLQNWKHFKIVEGSTYVLES